MPSIDVARLVHRSGIEEFKDDAVQSLGDHLTALGVSDDDVRLILDEFEAEWRRNLEFEAEWRRNLAEHDRQVIRAYSRNALPLAA